MTSTADKIKKLKALIADPGATEGERAAARGRLKTIRHPEYGMSDEELERTTARLQDTYRAMPLPREYERLRKERREELKRYRKERDKRCRPRRRFSAT